MSEAHRPSQPVHLTRFEELTTRRPVVTQVVRRRSEQIHRHPSAEAGIQGA